MVFMLRGIFANWKFYLSYFVAENSMRGDDLLPILFQNMAHGTAVGAVIRILVADQGSNNIKLFSSLGATVTEPFFEYDGRKIYVMHDPPHLIKSIRNTLLNHDIYCDEGIASWDVIKELRDTDRKSIATRACVKLTEKHVNPGI